MKPIREHLNDLPSPYKGQAIENWEKQGGEDAPVPEIYNALISAFSWDETREGADYWTAICEHYKYGSALPAPWHPHTPYTSPTLPERYAFMGKLIIAVQHNDAAYMAAVALVRNAEQAGVFDTVNTHSDKGALSDLAAPIENGPTTQGGGE